MGEVCILLRGKQCGVGGWGGVGEIGVGRGSECCSCIGHFLVQYAIGNILGHPALSCNI